MTKEQRLQYLKRAYANQPDQLLQLDDFVSTLDPAELQQLAKVEKDE
jgi:recombinational DNA repair ATPase RecF